MKKIRLLTSLVGLTGLSMGLVPAIASCSNSGLQIEMVSGFKEREFDYDTNGLAWAFKISDIKQASNLKVKVVDLTVDGAEAATVSGLVKLVYDSAGNIKVTINTETLMAQWPNGKTFNFSLQFTNKISGIITTFTDFTLNKSDKLPTLIFQTCGWDKLGEIIGEYYKGDLTEEQFCALFESDLGAKYTSFNDFIGESKKITINGVEYDLIIIGVNHDKLTSPEPASDTALFTFESHQCFQDSSSNAFVTQWDSNNSNNDYTTSTLFNALNSTSDVTWMTKSWTGRTSTSTYKKSVYSSLSDLHSIMKQVKKTVGVKQKDSWTIKDYDCYCFSLTCVENDIYGYFQSLSHVIINYMTPNEGTPYPYCTSHHESWAKRNDDADFFDSWTGSLNKASNSVAFIIDQEGVSESSILAPTCNKYYAVSFAFCI